jgi:hypothetical protein
VGLHAHRRSGHRPPGAGVDDGNRPVVDLIEWAEDVRAMICGHYRMTPSQVDEQTPSELREMMDGIDWVNDRAWERAVFGRTGSQKVARELLELSYPHFRVDRVVSVISDDDDEAPQRQRTLSGRRA